MMKNAGLTERVILFSRFLRNKGFKVFSSNTADALLCLEKIDISMREDFFSVLRANFVTNDMEWGLFGELFEEFWQDIEDLEEEQIDGPPEPEEGREDLVAEQFSETTSLSEIAKEEPGEKESIEAVTYSPVSSFKKRDLARFQKEDIKTFQLILKNMITPFRTSVTRRFRRSKRLGDIDFRRIIRKSLKVGGEPLELFYRKKKKRLKRLVLLVDVSGSMDRYARFVMPFIMGLRGVGPKAEVFVFSTCLTPITSTLRRFDIEKALEIISNEVPDWSGGTRIGYSLHQFNQQHGERLVNKRTVVVIMSDGWDLGGKNILRKEMETLNRKAHCVIWLNPLAGDSEYRPTCKGMETAFPYVDYFLPADNLQSLKKAGRTLSRVMIH